MVTDHTGVNKQAADLATKLKVTPDDNPTSQSLKAGGEKNVAKLKTLKGAAFDKAYIDNEVAYHQAVLDAVDKTLIPGASNAELKALLVKVRPAFVAHLEHAKKIQSLAQVGRSTSSSSPRRWGRCCSGIGPGAAAPAAEPATHTVVMEARELPARSPHDPAGRLGRVAEQGPVPAHGDVGPLRLEGHRRPAGSWTHTPTRRGGVRLRLHPPPDDEGDAARPVTR